MQPTPITTVPMLCVIKPWGIIAVPANLDALGMATYVMVTCIQVLSQGRTRVRNLIYHILGRVV